MSERQEERLYLLLDSVNNPLARGKLEGPQKRGDFPDAGAGQRCGEGGAA